jgi:hypothetical protein
MPHCLPFWSTVAVLAAVAMATPVTGAETATTNLIALTTFDAEAPASWGYGYYYSDGGAGIYEGPNREFYEPDDVEFTNPLLSFFFDNSALDGVTGYGTGFGAPLHRPDPDPALFISSNRVDYLFSFDARVEGLAPDISSANLEMQLQLFNAEADPQKILQVNLPFQPTPTWTRFAYNLEEGALGDGTSDTRFAAGYQNITGTQFNVNAHEPHGAFAHDGDNFIYLDNLRLEVIARPASTNTPLPVFPQTMAFWNMDDQPVWYTYHYQWSANEAAPVADSNLAAAGEGTDGSQAWVLNLDTTALASNPPAWAGGGMGGDGAIDISHFNTPDLSQYRVSFVARVDGLAEGVLRSSAVLQLLVRASDDTLQPPDENTDRDQLLRLDFPIVDVGTEWQPFSFTFQRGSVGSGTKADFETHFARIEQIVTQWQIENIANEAVWGYDDTNRLLIDNIRFERLYTGAPPVTVAVDGTDTLITWSTPDTGTAHLQGAPNVQGPYADIPGATSPYRTPLSGEERYFRTSWVP